LHEDRDGSRVSPVCVTALDAALIDPKLYRLLALLDALRMGRERERVGKETARRSDGKCRCGVTIRTCRICIETEVAARGFVRDTQSGVICRPRRLSD
jgi:hypothetical protein